MNIAAVCFLCLLSLTVCNVRGDEIDPFTLAIIKSVLKNPDNVKKFITAAMKNPKMIQDMSKMMGAGGGGKHSVEAYVKAAWEIMQDEEVMRGIMQGGWEAFSDMAKNPVGSVLDIVGGVSGLVIPKSLRKSIRVNLK